MLFFLFFWPTSSASSAAYLIFGYHFVGALFKLKIDSFMALAPICGLMSGTCRVCSARKVRQRLLPETRKRKPGHEKLWKYLP